MLYFPLAGFPKAILAVVNLNPLTYGVNGLRDTLVNPAHIGLLSNMGILAVITAVFVAIGTYLFSKIQI